MKRISMRRAFAYASVLVATLALAPSAFAHAELFPSSVPAGDGQLLMLTVPNEKEGASTTEIQITIPSGFDLEHVAPVPGWTPEVAGQHHDNGELAGGNSITWKGKLSGTELAVLPFTGVPKNAGEYKFDVRQTYSDGSVVEWSGSEASDTPAALITATSAASSSGGSDDTAKTIAIIALVLGGIALVVGGVALVSGRRST
jgi:uncharacterized protein YcnI